MNFNGNPEPQFGGIDWDNLDLSGTAPFGGAATSGSTGGFAGTSPPPNAPTFSSSLSPVTPAPASAPAPAPAAPAPASDRFGSAPTWAQHGISGNWSGLLNERPDVMREYREESTRDGKSISNLQRIGATTAENYARWWWDQFEAGNWAGVRPSAPTPPPPPPPGPGTGYVPPTLNDWVNTPLTPLPGTSLPGTPGGNTPPPITVNLPGGNPLTGVTDIGIPALGGVTTGGGTPATPGTTPPPTTPVTPPPATRPPTTGDAGGANIAQLSAEQQRLSALLNLYSPMAYRTRSNATSASIYNDDYLASIDDEIEQMLEQMGREKPSYGLNLSLDPYKSLLQGARETVATKRAAFNAGIQKELADITAARGRLGGVDAWDENGLNYVSSLLDREKGDLGRYTGLIDPAQNALDEAMRMIDERRHGLSTSRSGIEREAMDVINGLETADVGDTSALDALYGNYRTLKGKSQQWGATQSNDELEQIYSLLNGHKSRLATDARNVAARNDAEAARVRKDARGNSRFSRSVASRDGVMSEAQYGAYRSRLKDPYLQSYPSAFSSNLGL